MMFNNFRSTSDKSDRYSSLLNQKYKLEEELFKIRSEMRDIEQSMGIYKQTDSPKDVYNEDLE